MKLYNIFKDIIIERRILSEGVSKPDIEEALKSHKRIKIYYQGEHEPNPEVRYIDVYAHGVSTAGNEVIRVYQPFGTTTTNIGWKLMRLDRITRWEPTGFRFSEKALESDPTIPNRNPNGDESMVRVYAVAKFDKQQPVKKDNTVKKDISTNTTDTVTKDNTNNGKENPTGYDK
jgi:hypothetical protein